MVADNTMQLYLSGLGYTSRGNNFDIEIFVTFLLGWYEGRAKSSVTNRLP